MQLVNSCTEFDSYSDSKSIIERSVPFLASGRINRCWLAISFQKSAAITHFRLAIGFTLHAFLLYSVHGLAVQFWSTRTSRISLVQGF